LRELVAGIEPAVLQRAVDACERARFGDEPLDAGVERSFLEALRALPAPPR
jgi:hypothetical protein